MNDTPCMPRDGRTLLRWLTRLLILVINSVFMLILCLAITNEDKPQGPAIAVLILLALTMVGTLAAWRWERAGGAVVMVGALGTGVAAYSVSERFGLGSQSFLSAFIYGIPFLTVGILSWVCGHFSGAVSVE